MVCLARVPVRFDVCLSGCSARCNQSSGTNGAGCVARRRPGALGHLTFCVIRTYSRSPEYESEQIETIHIKFGLGLVSNESKYVKHRPGNSKIGFGSIICSLMLSLIHI